MISTISAGSALDMLMYSMLIKVVSVYSFLGTRLVKSYYHCKPHGRIKTQVVFDQR